MRLSFLVLLSFCFSTANAQTANVRLEDYIYDSKIATVLLYPGIDDIENPKRLLTTPIIPLQSTFPLILEYDDLTASFAGYRAKIIHCNADWTKSNLNDIEFTLQYNEYPISTYDQSFSTKVPYFHYRFEVPRLKISGNYVLVVYRDGDKRPVISRRFMVYEPKIGITAEARFSQGISQQFSDQQIDFKIDYKGFPLNAPQTDLKVVIRKNMRWDQIKTGFKPTNVRPFDQQLEYTFFNLENTFPGGNEFRYFDSRTLSGRGYGIQELQRTADFTKLILFPDKSRAENSYLQIDDFNGQYVVDQRESGRGSVEADYTPVAFTLRTAEDPDATFYVNGAFNLWQLNDRNKMTYNPDINAYEAEIFLKQGVINYDYTVVGGADKKPDEGYIEGNYVATENDYDILVYYRPQAGRSDLLVGYRTVEWNRRR
ncbi:type IX secretion system plug protein [Dyadobacter psychrotolerans]|uniref:DUF5103 domain-containing protein n=1 Tax=Dyadobacter psychrotolerans TaxID=2541721 RepID=A0A4V2Z4Y9_9BACT|nr:DUF5103 domain-containing protein [Dyadobacter psychrotolerans]TDE18638.1 DUF5103 domain-containing protein [Dyadobacter psychrotolerans]